MDSDVLYLPTVTKVLQSAFCMQGSASADSTNHRWKICGKKIPESATKQNLNLLHAGNYLHSIYVVLGIITDLEMI